MLNEPTLSSKPMRSLRLPPPTLDSVNLSASFVRRVHGEFPRPRGTPRPLDVEIRSASLDGDGGEAGGVSLVVRAGDSSCEREDPGRSKLVLRRRELLTGRALPLNLLGATGNLGGGGDGTSTLSSTNAW